MSAKNEITPSGNSRVELALIYFGCCKHVLHPSAEEATKHLRVLREALALCESPAAETDPLRLPHFCKDGHPLIGHRESELEMCPLCIALAQLSAAETWQPIAEAFIKYNLRNGGCHNCGGLPHTTTCFVGLFEKALGR